MGTVCTYEKENPPSPCPCLDHGIFSLIPCYYFCVCPLFLKNGKNLVSISSAHNIQWNFDTLQTSIRSGSDGLKTEIYRPIDRSEARHSSLLCSKHAVCRCPANNFGSDRCQIQFCSQSSFCYKILNHRPRACKQNWSLNFHSSLANSSLESYPDSSTQYFEV